MFPKQNVSIRALVGIILSVTPTVYSLPRDCDLVNCIEEVGKTPYAAGKNVKDCIEAAGERRPRTIGGVYDRCSKKSI